MVINAHNFSKIIFLAPFLVDYISMGNFQISFYDTTII